MRIGIAVPNGLPIPAIYGGAIEQLVTTVLDQNEKFGVHQIFVNAPYKPGMEEETEKYKYAQIYYQGRSHERRSLETIKKENGIEDDILAENFMWLKEIQPDVIVIEGGDYNAYLPFAKYFGKDRMVLHLHHDFQTWKRVENSFGTVITVSEYARRRYFSTATDKNADVVIVRNCANEESFKKKITEKEYDTLRKKLGYTAEDFIVVFCGRIIPEKGVLELVRAVKNIEVGNVKLLLIGSVNFKTEDTSDYYRRVLCEIEGTGGKIQCIGYVDNWELYQYYQIADIQVVPSTCEEVAGIVAIEGMMSGLPLITTDSGGLIEYVNEQCSYIIKRSDHMIEGLKNKIIYLYENNEKRNQMKVASFERAHLYSEEKYYKDFIGVCERVAMKLSKNNKI